MSAGHAVWARACSALFEVEGARRLVKEMRIRHRRQGVKALADRTVTVRNEPHSIAFETCGTGRVAAHPEIGGGL